MTGSSMMNRELNKKFNEEIARYRNALLYFAKKCEWDTFRIHAGRLFDYCESFESISIQREFFRISKIVVAALFFMLLIIVKTDTVMYQGFARGRELLTLMAIAGCCFEVYFFFNFRTYMQGKTIFYKKRRERFIKHLVADFKNISVPETAQLGPEAEPGMQPV